MLKKIKKPKNSQTMPNYYENWTQRALCLIIMKFVWPKYNVSKYIYFSSNHTLRK